MKAPVLISFCLFWFSILHAQHITAENYIDMYKNIAVAEMKRSGVPASVTLAQGLLETESGNSDLLRRSNNHFGIKCKKSWTGESVTHTDDAPNECFRKYPKAEDSFKDHSDYLKSSPRYAALFQLEASDYKGWAFGLRKAGYATNPHYPQILISNIEKYNLQQYDTVTTEVFVTGKLIGGNISEKNALLNADQPAQSSIDNALAGKTNMNGLRSVYVLKGTVPAAIAAKANMPLSKLLEYNDLISDAVLSDDQWIYLEAKALQGNRDFYIALQKERLYDIAQNNGIQLISLIQFNNMNGNAWVKKGRKIRLRSSVESTVSN